MRLNGHPTERLPNTSKVTVPSIEADALLMNMPRLALSLSSACNSGALELSYVLTELGLPRDLASSSFRLSLGKYSDEEALAKATQDIVDAVQKLAPHR